MLNVLKRLSLGVFLIFHAASVLLISDWSRRATKGAGIPRIGLLQHASVVVLDDGVRGMIDGIVVKGFAKGITACVARFKGDRASIQGN